MSSVRPVPIVTRPSGTGNLNDTHANDSIDFPSSDAGLKNKIKNYINFSNKGVTEKSVINDYFRGFLSESFQGNINAVSMPITVTAESYYKSKDNITFLINPGTSYYNPRYMRFVLPIKFTNADGSDLAATTIAANAFIGNLIKSIDVTTYNGEKMITPPTIEKNIRSYLMSQLKLIPSDRLKYMSEYSYSPKVVSLAQRDHTIDSTNTNIVDRIKKWHKRQKTGYQYYFDMYMLSPFFFNGLTEEKIKIVINLETNMQKIFEVTKKGDINAPAGNFTFTAAPELRYRTIDQSAIVATYFNNIFNTVNGYDYTRNIIHNEKRSIEMTTGSMTSQFTFNAMTGQMDFLRLSLIPQLSDNHPNPYCAYDVNSITSTIDNITLYNYYVGTNQTTLTIDFNKEDDKRVMYENYLAYIMDGCSMESVSGYVYNQLLPNVPTYEEYFQMGISDLPLIFDLRKSKGYSNPKVEPITRSDKNLIVKLQLKTAVGAENMLAVAHAQSFSGRYSLVKDVSGKTSLIYLPYNHT